MRRQTAPHTWVVAVDARTPGTIVDRLRRYPLTVMPMDLPHTVESLGLRLAETIPPGAATHLLTTRLDSDDALSAEHLARLQRAARAEDTPHFLNLPHGAMWCDGRLYACADPASPFISHVEPLAEGRPPLTAYRVAHVWAGRVAPVRQVWTARPMWLQLIGSQNEVSLLDGVRSPCARVPRGFRDHPALARLDTRGRWRELAASAPRYAMRHRRALRPLLARRSAAAR